MSAVEMILAEIQKRGIRIEADGDLIRYEAPKGSLTPELREAMARHKADLISLLARTHGQASPTGHGLCPGPQKCAACYAIPGGRYMHPPKPTQDWLDWLAKWQPKEGNAIQ